MNLLIRRCFEPDSIAFMKPAAVVAGVFDFDGKEGGDDGEGEGEEGEDQDVHCSGSEALERQLESALLGRDEEPDDVSKMLPREIGGEESMRGVETVRGVDVLNRSRAGELQRPRGVHAL